MSYLQTEFKYDHHHDGSIFFFGGRWSYIILLWFSLWLLCDCLPADDGAVAQIPRFPKWIYIVFLYNWRVIENTYLLLGPFYPA